MSIQALTWVIYGVAPDIKHADFRTLLVLADHADPQGMGAYPSRSTISRLTGYSVRTVSYALKSLESSGLISRGDLREMNVCMRLESRGLLEEGAPRRDWRRAYVITKAGKEAVRRHSGKGKES